MTLHIFTSAALNYLPKVQRLVQSVRHFHPEAKMTLALADVPPQGARPAEGFDRIISVADLDLPDWRAWAFGHTLVELATAIKPFVLERLLSDDSEGDVKVIYLDPDTVLFDRLDDVVDTLDHASVALTPHLVTPESSTQGILDNEMAALKHGIYNLGFVAVKADPTGKAVAAWWRRRCQEWCIDDIPNGLFTDQRWMDLVPALFPAVAILRSSRLNVAPWNVNHRPIEEREGHYWVNKDEKLGFYHFTGFDSGAHDVMADRYGQHSPAVRKLIEDYRAFVKQAASEPLSQHPWAFAAFDNGEPIPRDARRLYRAREDLKRAFPDPFGESFLRWWQAEGVNETTPPLRPSARAQLTQAITRPGDWLRLLKRAWRIWRDEGLQGVKKRWG